MRLEKDPDNSEWYVCQLACDGIPCVPFSVATPDVYSLLEKSEATLAEYLERQARSLIERYGDGRSPRPDPVLLSESAA